MLPPRRFVVAVDQAGQRLDLFLAAMVPEVSRTQLGRAAADGAVTVGGLPAVPSRKVRPGDVVVWTPRPAAPTELVAEEIPLVVVHEDRHLVVIDKPAGLVVHPAAGHQQGTLVNALLARVKDLRGVGGELRPGIVHRLDKDTSGLMVIAKDDATMNALGAAFREHAIDRAYQALAVGTPPAPSGRIETLHGRDPRDRKRFSTKVRTGKKAITNWRVLERLGGAAHLEASLETGRTHQVRVHFAALGLPLLGDPVYARPPRDPALRAIATALGRQALHAKRLGFVHPATGRTMRWDSDPPPDFARALAALRALAG